MSNNNIDEFVVSIKLETDKLNQSFANLSSKFDNLGKDISTRFDKSFSEKKLARSLDKSKNVLNASMPVFKNILTKGLIGIGAIVGADFALQFIKGFSSKSNNLQLISSAVGSTTRNTQVLQRLYEQAGISPDTANQTIYQLYKRLHSGMPDVPLAKSLQILGEQFNPNTDPVELILRAYKKTGAMKGGNREVLRNQLLGGLGIDNEAATLFANNPDKFNKYLESAQKNLISDETLQQYADMDRRFQDLGQRWKSIESSVMDNLLPAFEFITNSVEGILGGGQVNRFKDYYNNQQNKTQEMGFHGMSGFLDTTKKSFNDLWSFVTGIESSGGKNKERDNRKNNSNDYSFGSGHITLGTARMHMPNVTPEMLRANNYQLADELAKKELARNLKQSNGNVMEALSRYHTGKPDSSTQEMQRYLSSGYKFQQDIQQSNTRQNHGAINHNKQISYNINGGITMNGVQNVKGFSDELQKYALDTTAFNLASNVLS